jgi:hypothetical protein
MFLIKFIWVQTKTSESKNVFQIQLTKAYLVFIEESFMAKDNVKNMSDFFWDDNGTSHQVCNLYNPFVQAKNQFIYSQTCLRAYPSGEGFLCAFKQVMPLEGVTLQLNQDLGEAFHLALYTGYAHRRVRP